MSKIKYDCLELKFSSHTSHNMIWQGRLPIFDIYFVLDLRQYFTSDFVRNVVLRMLSVRV